MIILQSLSGIKYWNTENFYLFWHKIARDLYSALILLLLVLELNWIEMGNTFIVVDFLDWKHNKFQTIDLM